MTAQSAFSSASGSTLVEPSHERWRRHVDSLADMPRHAFDVVDVTTWEVIGEEPAGLDEKRWLLDPTGTAWLFKPVVVRPDRQQGEDWSEKVAGEIGRALGIPCAAIELASLSGRAGCISRDLVPRGGWEIHSGSVLLSGILANYQPKARGRPGHSLENVRRAIGGLGIPPGCQLPDDFEAFDVFAGYLVLDALVANQDRHDENWSVLRPPTGRDVLAGSYDHASSLGFNLVDGERERRLREGTVHDWARRGLAAKFELQDGRSPGLVAHAAAALALCQSTVRSYWLEAVARLDEQRIHAIVSGVPDMSVLTGTFVEQAVTINRERVLHEC